MVWADNVPNHKMQFEPAQIADAINRLRTSQPQVFGANSHRFQLNPPLSEDVVAAFEHEHQVELPSDYRAFLTVVANGGAGPFYGIFPLGEMDDGFGLRAWREDDGFVGVLSDPFPLTDDWNDLSGLPLGGQVDPSEADYDAQMEAFEESYWSSSLMNGAIPICHEGCALRVWLVVSGPEAGRLWEDRRSEQSGIKRIRTVDGSSATFTSWYLDWLQNCLTNCDRVR